MIKHFITIGIIATMVLFIFLYEINNKVTTITEITPVTSDEYLSIGTYELENPTKEDFMKLVVEVNVRGGTGDGSIEVPNFRDVINSIDGQERYRFGSMSHSDTSFWIELVFLSRGLEKADIQKAFQNEHINIHFDTDNNQEIAISFYVRGKVKSSFKP
ncbi:hypothetical protein ACIQ2D_05065 [Lysinibacillus sp. NPDC097287]|uniref:hypothetical protein n=1 Tax=Lysinibacillus sp. NPDC097287 TaxID=3364144 RepID=UPI00380C82A7